MERRKKRSGGGTGGGTGIGTGTGTGKGKEVKEWTALLLCLDKEEDVDEEKKSKRAGGTSSVRPGKRLRRTLPHDGGAQSAEIPAPEEEKPHPAGDPLGGVSLQHLVLRHPALYLRLSTAVLLSVHFIVCRLLFRLPLSALHPVRPSHGTLQTKTGSIPSC